MMKDIAAHFKAARLAKGLTIEGLAALTGYRNTRKVTARIGRFEQEGVIKDELLARIADALGIEFTTIEELLPLDGVDAFPAFYVLQRRDDGRFLTPEYLCWSLDVQDAQQCDLDAAKAIQGWLKGFGVRVSIRRSSK